MFELLRSYYVVLDRARGRGRLGQGPLGPSYRIHMEIVTTYCKAVYLLSGKLPTVVQATHCQACSQPLHRLAPNNRTHAPTSFHIDSQAFSLALAEAASGINFTNNKHQHWKRGGRKHLGAGGGAGNGGGSDTVELLYFDWEHKLIDPKEATGSGGGVVVPLKEVAGFSLNADDAMLASVVRECEAPRIKECKAADGERSTFNR